MLPNLIVGLPVMLLCLILQTTFTFWTVRYYVRASDSNTATGARVEIWPLLIAMLILTAGNLLQITLWGALFLALGEFSEFYEAIYHSGVNFASLGYGDIVGSGSGLPSAVVFSPPSTYMISPVMPLARSESMKAAALPTSSMVMLRRSGALCAL
jgi:hypothetical protein